jgi:hypothetical protein
MAYGELVAQVRADLAQLDKDLATARGKLKRFYDDAVKMSVPLRGGGARGGGGGATAGGPLDANFRYIEAQRQAAERQQRQFSAAQQSAERENQHRAEQVRARANQALRQDHASRMADTQQIIRGRRELAAEDAKVQREGMRLAGARQQADKEAQQRTLVAIKATEAENERVRANALKFFRQQSGLGPVGGMRPPGGGPAGVPGGAPGSFFAPSNLRGLDSVSSKWLKIQQDIGKTGTITERLGKRFETIGNENLKSIVDGTKQWTSLLATGLAGAAVGTFGLLAKTAFDTNVFYERSKITIAEVLALTTKLSDAQGHVVGGVKEQNANYILAEKLIAEVRAQSVRTAFNAQQLVNITAQGLGFAVSAGAKPMQAVPMIAQIANLSRALGARSEQAQGQDVRALFTGQRIGMSRVGRVLGLSQQDIQQHRAAGDLIQFLTERLKAGQPYLDRWASSWEGLTTTFQTHAQVLLQLSLEKTYDKIRERLGDINKVLTPERLKEWAETFSRYALQAFDAIDKFFHSDGFKNAMGFFKYLVDHAGEITKIFAALLALKGVTAARALLLNQNRPGALFAGTRVGQSAETLANLGLSGAGQRAGDFIGAEGGVINALKTLGASLAGIAGPAGLVVAALADVALAAHLAQLAFQTAAANQNRAQTEAETRLIRAGLSPAHVARLKAGANELSFADVAGRNRRALEEALPAATEQARQSGTGITPGMSPAEIQQRLPGILQQGQAAGLERTRQSRYDNEQARQNSIKTQIEIQRILKKTHDQQADQLRDAARAEILKVQKDIVNEKTRSSLISQIRQKLARDLDDLQKEENIKYEKTLAEQTGNKRLALQADYEATVKAIDDEDYTEAKSNRLKLAAHQKYLRDRHELETQERLDQKEYLAKATGDEIQQLKNTAQREFEERRKQLLGEGKSAADIHKEYVVKRTELDRNITAKELEWAKQGRDLIRQEADLKANLQRTEITHVQEIRRLQSEQAKERLQALSEERDAQESIQRLTVDRAQAAKRLFATPAQEATLTLPSGKKYTRTVGAAQPALVDEQESIRQAAEKVFGGSQEVLTRQFSGQGQSAELAAANAAGAIRELVSGAQQPGGTEGVLQRAQALGINVTPDMRQQLQTIGARSLNLQGRTEALQHEGEQIQVGREKEDIDKALGDAVQRYVEFQEKELVQERTLQDEFKKVGIEYQKSISDLGTSAINLREEFIKLTKAMQASHENVSPTVLQFTGPITLNGVTNPKEFVDKLQRDQRLAAPARK